MIPAFFIDYSALRDMFNGENKGQSAELLKKFKDIHNSGKPMKIVTTKANFLRAIWLANPEVKINNVQKILNFLEIMPFIVETDFKNENKVREETIQVAKLLAGRKI